jgi:hypothetical protein
MARGRDIKPGFFDNEDLATVSRDARLLFVALWTMADREGRLEDRPARIKVHSFPYDADITPERIDKLLNELARAPGTPISRYEIAGVRCICVANFKKHQHIHPNEKPSELPAPTVVPETSGKATNSSGNYALPSVPSSLLCLPPDCSEVEDDHSEPDKPSDPVLLVFPCAKGESWDLTETIRAELSQAFPAADVMACARHALEWLRANPKKIKTRQRMRGWLGSVWCAKEQDRPQMEFRQGVRLPTQPQAVYPVLTR